MELWEEIIVIERQLNEALSTFRENGIKYCEAERNYQMAKSKEIMRLKSEGYPITLIPQVVKGIEHIAELDLIRNIAEVVYKANQEALNVKKLELRVKEGEINREYGRNDSI